MKISIPAPAEEIIGKLNEYGYEAYVVGGCVRDMMLGREPGDWDITTSALPDQVKQVFRRTVDTGIQHGTVTVMMGNEGYEVTTYRIDGEYSDGRHPNHVEFTPNLAEDLKRRDFTINAMAYNSRTGFVDEFGGAEDLKKGIIRCVGEPMDRFTEDALRILRAIRFSAQLGFLIEDRTYEAIRKIAPNMVHVSKERIQTELTKLLLSSHPGHMELVYETGISSYVSDAFHRAYWREEEAGKVPASFQSAVERTDRRVPLIPASIAPEKHMRWAGFLRRCTPDHGGTGTQCPAGGGDPLPGGLHQPENFGSQRTRYHGGGREAGKGSGRSAGRASGVCAGGSKAEHKGDSFAVSWIRAITDPP